MAAAMAYMSPFGKSSLANLNRKIGHALDCVIPILLTIVIVVGASLVIFEFVD